MTLVIRKPATSKLVMRKGWQPMDSDAAAYIAAVETADGQALEEKTKIAIDNFVLGCKADGIWTAIKASCILAGARTLAGALVPLVGAAPTNNNFVAGDYNRKTGLLGNRVNKYLNTNRAASLDAQNDFHCSALATTSGFNTVSEGFLIGANNNFYRLASTITSGAARFNTGNAPGSFLDITFSTAPSGLYAVARNNGSTGNIRVAARSFIHTAASVAPETFNYFVYARNNVGSPSGYTDARLGFYSFGSFLDLALLDARVTDLITAIGAAF